MLYDKIKTDWNKKIKIKNSATHIERDIYSKIVLSTQFLHCGFTENFISNELTNDDLETKQQIFISFSKSKKKKRGLVELSVRGKFVDSIFYLRYVNRFSENSFTWFKVNLAILNISSADWWIPFELHRKNFWS